MKTTCVLNLFRKVIQGCSKQAKARAYIALNCSSPCIWRHAHPSGHLIRKVPMQDDLEKVQKCAARWICVKWDKANHCWTKTYEECSSDLNWATVHQRHLLLTCCQGYKIINKLNCLQFDNYFCFNQSSTRSHKLTLCCASSRINAYRYSFFINLSFLWNTIPFNITSYGEFKSKLKLFFI